MTEFLWYYRSEMFLVYVRNWSSTSIVPLSTKLEGTRVDHALSISGLVDVKLALVKQSQRAESDG